METIDKPCFVGRSIASACLGFALAGSLRAQVTSIVSVDLNGQAANKDSLAPAISADGRYVAFFSYDDLLAVGGESLLVHSDVYLHDRLTGAVERVSVSSNEVQGNSFSYGPALTPDVRYVGFSSYATNLVPGDTNGPYPIGHDVFVRDRQTGTTERVSVGAGGAQSNGDSFVPSLSDDGRYVAFQSDGGNLVPGDTNAVTDIFVRDRVGGTTERVNLDSSGAQANGASSIPFLSADARYVVFASDATNLVVGDTNAVRDIFVRDRQTGTTERVSVDSSGAQANSFSYAGPISADGRYVAFASNASNLVAGDSNGVLDSFVRDRQTGTTERVSVSSGGAEGNGDAVAPAISSDGRQVAFQSESDNLVAGDTNGRWDMFLRDRLTGTTERVSVASNGAQGNADSGIQGPAISADGRYVAFDSLASFVEADANSWNDVYVRDRGYEPLESVCAPGEAGVLACPCSNPPGVPGRGCDNSAGTGGASLRATGVAHLSMDSLVFTTSGELASVLSLLLQGDALVPGGAVFGQGVRCAGGALRRLYAQTASGGGITAPDFGAGDPTVSARSAALGDVIQAGESRWYLVYYRDPVVLGGCPAGSTFNATPTGEVLWLP